MKTPTPPAPALNRALGFLTAWLALGLTNVLLVSLDVPSAPSFWSIRAVHHAVDLGRHTTVGLLSFAVVLLWARFREAGYEGPYWRLRLEGLGALFAVALCVSAAFVHDDILGMAQRTAEATSVPASLLEVALVTGIALSIPLAAWCGAWARRGYLRLLGLPVAVVLHWLNVTTSTRDNHGLHLFLSWLAATCLAFACTWPEHWASKVRLDARRTQVALAALALLGVVGVFVPLTNSQRIDLTLWDANLLPNLSLGRGAHARGSATTDGKNPYFATRRGQAPLPARPHALLGNDGVVLLLSIDAVRSDVLVKKHAKRFPNLMRLLNEGTAFTNARTPGSATVFTLSALSTGETFSQRYWTKTKGDYWPYEDEALHFPALLNAAGVATLQARSTNWLENDRRLMSGFSKDVFPKKDWKWARGKDLARGLVDLLEQHPEGPVFAFTHFLDTHHPYWPGRKKSKDTFQQYLHALGYVDTQVGTVLKAISDLGMEDRAIVIVTADHGEAFGEHGTHAHATTLYEEQVRVPLLFWGKTLKARKLEQPVTVLDLGPTILELYGQDTPSQFMGQSLVPLLQGKKMSFERPMIAEARTLQSLVTEDGIKVIRDRRTGTFEIYDLNEDPKELKNLSDDADPRLEAVAARLDEFFEVHTLKRKGYKVPLRK